MLANRSDEVVEYVNDMFAIENKNHGLNIVMNLMNLVNLHSKYLLWRFEWWETRLVDDIEEELVQHVYILAGVCICSYDLLIFTS